VRDHGPDAPIGSSTRIRRPTLRAGAGNRPAWNQRYAVTRATQLRSAHTARFIPLFLQHTTDNYRPLNPQQLVAPRLVLRAMIVLLAAGSATIADAARALAIGHHMRSQSSAGSVRSWDTRPSCSQRAGGSQEHAVSAPRATTELRPQKGAHHVDHEPPQRC